MKIVVAVLCVLLFALLHLSFSFCPLPFTRLDIVILDEAVVVVIQPAGRPSNHLHSSGHAVREGHVILAILADPVCLLEQGVPVAGQEAMEEAKLDHHHDED